MEEIFSSVCTASFVVGAQWDRRLKTLLFASNDN